VPIATEPNVGSYDTPINSGGIAISAATYTDITDRSKDRIRPYKEMQGGRKIEREGNTAGTSEKQRMLREIDVAAVMREHLAETNPELTTAASFLDSVCGRICAPKKTEMSESTAAQTSESTAAQTSESTATRKSEVGTTDQPSYNTVWSSRAVSGYGEIARVDKYQGGGDV